MDELSELADSIYEAAFVPDGWRNVLDGAAAASGSASGALLVFADPTLPPRFKTTELTEQALRQHVTTDEWKQGRTAEVPRVPGRNFSAFTHVADFLQLPADAIDPVAGRLRAIGLDAQAGTLIPMLSGERALFTFERWLRDGRHSEQDMAVLNQLRPHLARASIMAIRLGLERAADMVAVQENLGLPAAVLKADGVVIAANALFESMEGIFVSGQRGQLHLVSSDADPLLQQAVATSSHSVVRSIALPRTIERGAVVVHVLPLRRAAHDIFFGGEVMVIAAAVTPTGSPSIELLRGLFDLTPAEARVAAALVTGRTLQEAAADSGVQVSTARSYLERIFSKTGTHQQSQLVGLLKSAELPPGAVTQ